MPEQDCGCRTSQHPELDRVFVIDRECFDHRIVFEYLTFLHPSGGHEICCGDLDRVRQAINCYGVDAVRGATKVLNDLERDYVLGLIEGLQQENP